jgi:uncharacterized protein (TIGR02145 family)
MKKIIAIFIILNLIQTIANAQTIGNGVTDNDGVFYSSVIIGTQEWTTQNLNSSHYRNGDSIPFIIAETGWNWNSLLPQSCYYEYDSFYGELYGKLYNWYAVSDPRGLCPLGWSVPNDNDWNTLNSYLGIDSAGYKMRDTLCCDNGGNCDYAWWECFSSNSFNSSGFSAKPSSCFSGEFGGNYPVGSTAIWWSSSEIDINNAELRIISRNNDGINNLTLSDLYFSNSKSNGFSARCIRDTVYSISGLNPIRNQNTLKVFPNPANTNLTIDCVNFSSMSVYKLIIVNANGQTVFAALINQQISYIDLSTWTGSGIYYMQLIDTQNNTIENRKIIIQ